MMRQFADTPPRAWRTFVPAVLLTLLLALPSVPVAAQGGPPPMPGDGSAPGGGDDPPARVGRLSYISGTVSFHTLDDDQWEPAVVNYPVTEGLSFWTEPGSRASLQLGHGVARLDGSTEVDVQQFNDQVVQINVPQGAINFRLRRLDPDETYQITTPSGTVALTSPGRYHVDAGSNGGPGGVTVFRGTAQLVGDNNGMVISSGQQAVPQDIDGWSDQQEAQVTQTPNYLSADMPGVDDLAGQGNWDRAPDGPVWFPPVQVGWAPYRYGHWGFVPPWGWTWIDDASWGFAPFHYGRWAQFNGRWGWVPGERVERPVYAPALVAFVGGGGLSVGIGVGSAVGWVPLGPREVYVPPYGGSIDYVRRVNRTNVTNVNNITINNITVNRSTNNFVNASAATVVPASAMAGSAHIASAAIKVSPTALSTATVSAQPSVKPTSATVGAGPTVVKALGGNVTPDQRRTRAPGPKVEAKPLPATLIKPLTNTAPTTGGAGGVKPGPAIVAPTTGAGAGAGAGNKNVIQGQPPGGSKVTTTTTTGAGAGAGAGPGTGNPPPVPPGPGSNANTNTSTGGPGTGAGNKNVIQGQPGSKVTTTTTTGAGQPPVPPAPGSNANTNTGTGGPGAGAGNKNVIQGQPGSKVTTTTTTGAGAGVGAGPGKGNQPPVPTGPGPNANTNINTNTNANTGGPGAGAGNKNVIQGQPGGPKATTTTTTGAGAGAGPGPGKGNQPMTGPGGGAGTGQPAGGGQPGGGNKAVQTNVGKPPPPPPQQGGDKAKCDPKVQKCPPQP